MRFLTPLLTTMAAATLALGGGQKAMGQNSAQDALPKVHDFAASVNNGVAFTIQPQREDQPVYTLNNLTQKPGQYTLGIADRYLLGSSKHDALQFGLSGRVDASWPIGVNLMGGAECDIKPSKRFSVNAQALVGTGYSETSVLNKPIDSDELKDFSQKNFRLAVQASWFPQKKKQYWCVNGGLALMTNFKDNQSSTHVTPYLGVSFTTGDWFRLRKKM